MALAVSRWRGVDWRRDLAMTWPAPRVVAVWLGIWAVWLVVGEVLINQLGLAQAETWPPYPATILALRILAIGVCGPLAEELVFRGLLYWRLAPRLGPSLAIGIVAAVWAVLHLRYGWGTVGLIAADGVVLGLARERSRSLYVPMLLHVVGNLISIGQSLAG